MVTKNKVKYGLKNVYYSAITEVGGVISYATPKPNPGAINLTMSAAGEKVKFPADDIEDYYSENVNNGYDGSLEIATVSDDFRVDILGDTIDTNGALVENKDATVKRFALMFEFSGDVKKTRHVLYNVLANRPNVESSTTSSTKEPKSETLDIEARPAVDTGDVKAKVYQGNTGYDTFFTAVYLKNAVTNTVAASTATFSKAAPANLTIDSTSSDGTNAVKNVLMDGLPVYGIHLTPDGVDVTIADDYLGTLVNGTHTITVEFVKGNTVTVALTVTA